MKFCFKVINCLLSLIILSLISLTAQQMQSDNGDGTYTNPIIYADFPDPDVIRVDSVYYFVSTTMFIFPGVTILKSYDLVNWEYCSNAVTRMDFSPCYNLDGCNRYKHGQWATSLKYHNGKFYLLFITLDDGGFIVTATNPEGPWEIKKLPRGFYDPGLFFDDDGKIYIAHGYSTINITEVDSNFVAIDRDSLVFTGDIRSGLEGSHVYKINGYYYLYSTYGGGDGFQVALRSKNIYGPYEEKIVIRDNGNLGTGIHQGALIETQTGEWWSVIFQDGGAFGRFPTLQPVSWQNDWPMVGVDGKGVVTYKKPNVGREYPVAILPTSDEFSSFKLGMQWGWNHNPDSTKWSLTQNEGYLRLSTVNVTSNLRNARNTLTQRIFAYYSRTVASTAAIKMEVDKMNDGDVAGLAVFQDPYAYIGIKKMNGRKYIVMVNNGKTIDSIATDKSTIYLRAQAIYSSSKASFSYSFDNESFIIFGNDLAMQFNLSIFTGNKFCLFNYATIATGGYVDIDWFRTDLCPQSKIESYLKVNDGILMDTSNVTINLGDSVILKPKAFNDGNWSWFAIGISGLTDILTIHPERSLAYTATFTNSCGMKSSLQYIVNVIKTNKINSSDIDSGIKVFPNPAHNELQISSNIFFDSLFISNSEGKELIQKKYSVPIQKINLSVNLRPGVYFLLIKNDKASETMKIIIK
jgi:beta-xylosidase